MFKRVSALFMLVSVAFLLQCGNSYHPAAQTVGPQGPAGQAATLTVGTTTTGAPGSAAQVTNSGTSSAAVLNFVIPQGSAGPQGPAGPAGVTGPQGSIGPQGPTGNGLVGTPFEDDLPTPFGAGAQFGLLTLGVPNNPNNPANPGLTLSITVESLITPAGNTCTLTVYQSIGNGSSPLVSISAQGGTGSFSQTRLYYFPPPGPVTLTLVSAFGTGACTFADTHVIIESIYQGNILQGLGN